MIRTPLLLLSALLALAPATHAGADFNGSSGFYELASNLGFAGDAEMPMTVSIWFSPDGVTGNDVAFCIEDKGDQNRVALELAVGIPNARATVSGGTSSLQAASKTCTIGRAYHMVAVLSDTQTEAFVWVDGSFLGGGSGTTRALADLDTTTLGCSWSVAPAAQFFFDGKIYDVAVWSGALTEAEVQRLTLDRHSVRSVRPERLVLHCSGTSLTGTICTDTVGLRAFTKNGTIADSGDEGPNGFTPPGLGTWTPADLTPAVWLKGDAGVTGSAPVTAWADQSGSGNDLDNTGTGAPALVATGYGGKNGVAFTSDSLYGEPAPVTAAPFYLLSVWDLTGTTANDAFVWVGDKDGDGEAWSIRTSTADIRLSAVSAGGGSDSAISAGAGFSPYTVCSIEGDETSSTSRRISINAGQQGTNTGSNSPAGADRYSVGRHDDLTPDLPLAGGTLYELVITTTAPTDAQRNLWSVYVAHRWNVTGGAWRRE